eukprot:gene13301-13430_t
MVRSQSKPCDGRAAVAFTAVAFTAAPCVDLTTADAPQVTAITSAAEVHWRPSNKWLAATWQRLDELLAAARQNQDQHQHHQHHHEVQTAVVQAAYTSLFTFKFHSHRQSGLWSAFQKATERFDIADGGCDSALVWLQSVCISGSFKQLGEAHVVRALQSDLRPVVKAVRQMVSSTTSTSSSSEKSWHRHRHNLALVCQALPVLAGSFPQANVSQSSPLLFDQLSEVAWDLSGHLHLLTVESTLQLLDTCAMCGLVQMVLSRLRHQLPAAVVLLSAAVCGSRALPLVSDRELLELITLSSEVLPVMSLAQLQAYLLALVEYNSRSQARDGMGTSSRPITGTGGKIPTEAEQALFGKQLSERAAQLLLEAISTTTTTTTSSSSSREAIKQAADILRYLQQLPVVMSPAAAQGIQQMLPHLATALKPAEVFKWNASFTSSQMQIGLMPATAVEQASSTPATAADSHTHASKPFEPSVAFCFGGAASRNQRAAEAAALLTNQQKLQLPGNPAAAAQVLCDLAVSLGASDLPVRPAVMDLLAVNVNRVLEHCSSQQLVMFAWAFVRNTPSSAARGVMNRLVMQAAAAAVDAAAAAVDAANIDATAMLTNREQRVCYWAISQLDEAFGT